MESVVKIAVENTAYHFDRDFDYRIPKELEAQAKIGCRVLVPFGRANAYRQGIILAAADPDDGNSAELKSVISLLDRKPLLTREAVSLVYWIKEHYFCTLFEAARLFIPAGILMKLKVGYSLTQSGASCNMEELKEEEKQIVAYLSKRGPTLREKLLKDLGLSSDCCNPENLIKKGILLKTSDAVRQIGDATRKMVGLADCAELPKLSRTQKRVYDILRDVGCASQKELCYYSGASPSVVNALAVKGVARIYEMKVYRNPYGMVPERENPPEIDLTTEQENAYRRLIKQYESGAGGVSLLYGVTGSGKTSVFMKLIDRVRSDSVGIIVMVPEISLTPQTVSLFHERYGPDVAVFHSGLTLAERMDEWKRVNNGDASIVVGTRSAVFAPFHRIGLIIIDEEQEGTYKSESTPRYHAREVAKYRCACHKALLVLSSATPSVCSYYLAQAGNYSLNTLTQRYGPAQLPEVSIVDMNLEQEKGNSSIFSGELADALKKNLEDGKQSILLLNRRGYQTFVSCRACGHVMTCPNCSITLTYHAANGRLMCHYCGYSTPMVSECPVCHSEHIHSSGFGTQRAQEQLQELLPQARILRLDADSTLSRFSYDKKLRQFADGEYDVIIGTQMVAKGLDFENVTLAGVLSADQALYGDDFRSYERAFDLLTQVVGRSGRGQYPGKAIIQTFTPENGIIRLAAKQNYPEFYKGEIAMRKSMLYPPFADICVFGFVGTEENSVRKASVDFLSLLKQTASGDYADQPMRVLNPTPAAVGRVSNKFRYKMIVKCRNSRRIRRMISDLLKDFSSKREYSRITIFADINPETIL